MKALLCICLMSASVGCSAEAREFDWSLLEGHWAESTGGQYACRPGSLGHRFAVSPDKTQLTFHLNKEFRQPEGQRAIKEYTADILSATDNSLMIKYSLDMPGMTEETSEWELRFIGPGAYRWRPASWPADRYNAVIGVQCSP